MVESRNRIRTKKKNGREKGNKIQRIIFVLFCRGKSDSLAFSTKTKKIDSPLTDYYRMARLRGLQTVGAIKAIQCLLVVHIKTRVLLVLHNKDK